MSGVWRAGPWKQPKILDNLARLCRENSKRKSKEPPEISTKSSRLPGRAKRQELVPQRKDQNGSAGHEKCDPEAAPVTYIYIYMYI